MIQVQATYASPPAATVRTAELFGNMDYMFMFQADDGYAEDFSDIFKVTNGGTVNGITYPGVKWNDGTGRLLNMCYTFALNWASTALAANNNTLTTPAQYAQMAAAGHAIASHSYRHNEDGGLAYEVSQNRQAIFDAIGYSVRVGVVPSSIPGFVKAFFDDGCILVNSEGFRDDGAAPYQAEISYGDRFLVDQLNVAPYHAERMISSRHPLDNDITDSMLVEAKKWVETRFSDSFNQGHKIGFTAFSHLVSPEHTDELAALFAYIQNHAKNVGGKKIGFPSSQDFAEYQEARRLSVLSTPQVSGNTLSLSIDQSAIPAVSRNRSMSLLLPAGLQAVSVSGANDYTYDSASGLLNLYVSASAASATPTPVVVDRGILLRRRLTASFSAAPGGTAGVDSDPYLRAGNESLRVAGLIPLTYRDVYVLNNVRRVDALVDGSTSQPDLGSGTVFDQAVAETWFCLKRHHAKVSTLRIYNSDNAGGYGAPVQWYYVPQGKFAADRVLLGSDDGLLLGSVKEYTLPANTPVSWLIRKGPTFYPKEVQLLGSYIPDTYVYPAKARLPLRNQLGVNGFVFDFEPSDNTGSIDPVKLANAKLFLGGVRFYLDADSFEPEPEQYTFEPVSHGFWHYDLLAATCKQNGLLANFVLRGQSGAILRTYPAADRNGEKTPIPYALNDDVGLANPASYVVQAKWAWQTAARLGTGRNLDGSDRTAYLRTRAKVMQANTTKPSYKPGRLELDGTEVEYFSLNQVKVGLNTLAYLECDNERDKWWMGRQGYQTAREYAANLSAFYDGHQGRLGPGVGVKDADPFMKVAMMGVALPTEQYVRGMVDWCAEFRGYLKNADGSIQVDGAGRARVDLPFDVINFHVYCNDAGTQRAGLRGIPPENPVFLEPLQRWTELAAQLGKEVWLSEIGWDTGYGSPQRSARLVDITEPVVAGDSASEVERKVQRDNTPAKQALREQAQADWNLRAALLAWAAGIDRTFFYWIADTGAQADNYTVFASCAFIKQDKSRKPAARYFEQVGNLLADYTWQATLSTSPYVLQGSNGSQTAYFLWSGTETGLQTSYTFLSLPSGCVLHILNQQTGTTIQQALPAGLNTISVTETPCLVQATA